MWPCALASARGKFTEVAKKGFETVRNDLREFKVRILVVDSFPECARS